MATLSVPVTQSDHILGDDRAKVTLLEYGDYQCPYCGMAYPIVKQLQADFGDQVRFVFRHFPLTEVHPLAESAAEAAEFAGAHGRFWEMHDRLYENQRELGIPLYFAIAESLGLPDADLREAVTNELYASKVEEDFLGGVRSGVNGTPAFYINDRRHDGSYAYEDLRSSIDAQLSAAP